MNLIVPKLEKNIYFSLSVDYNHWRLKIMVNKTYKVPFVYRKMDDAGFTNADNSLYLWLNEMEWIPIYKQKEKNMKVKKLNL